MLPILPMPPTASVAIGREGEGTNAADRVMPLHRVPGIHSGASSVAVAYRIRFPRRRCGRPCRRWPGIGRPPKRRRQRASTESGAASAPRGRAARGSACHRGVPEPADHVVGDAGDDRAVGRDGDVANPFRWASTARMRRNSMSHQMTGHRNRRRRRSAGQRQAGDVTVCPPSASAPAWLREVDVVNLEVGAPKRSRSSAGHAGQREGHVPAGSVLDDLELLGAAAASSRLAGGSAASGEDAPIGSVPGSVRGREASPRVILLVVDPAPGRWWRTARPAPTSPSTTRWPLASVLP